MTPLHEDNARKVAQIISDKLKVCMYILLCLEHAYIHAHVCVYLCVYAYKCVYFVISVMLTPFRIVLQMYSFYSKRKR